MKFKMKKKQINSNALIRILFSFLLLICISCRIEHDFCFDINLQEVVCCDKKRIYYLDISSKDDSVSLRWTGKREDAPKKLKIDSIPKEYEQYRGGLSTKKKFKLNRNSKYLIEKGGGGGVDFTINIWTDSNGKVFKTSHPTCRVVNL